MDTRWIVVAHRAGARVFRCRGAAGAWEPVTTLEHPAGRLRGAALGSDRPGRAYDRVGRGRHAMSSEQSPQQRVEADFARALARSLADGRRAHAFEQLVLVAEPHFLGLLRHALDRATTACVIAQVAKDLVHVADHDLPEHVMPHIAA